MSKIRFGETSEPVTPNSGKGFIYLDSADKHLKLKDDTGAVKDLVEGDFGQVVTVA